MCVPDPLILHFRPGVVQVKGKDHVGVLTLAVAAGLLTGVKGTPAAPRSPSAEPGGGPLPATLALGLKPADDGR